MASPSPHASPGPAHLAAVLVFFFLSAAFLLQPLYLPRSLISSDKAEEQLSSFAERAAINQMARIAIGAKALADDRPSARRLLGPLQESLREGEQQKEKLDVLLMRLALYDALGMNEAKQEIRRRIEQRPRSSVPGNGESSEKKASLEALRLLEQIYIEGAPVEPDSMEPLAGALGFVGKLARVHNLQLRDGATAESEMQRLRNEAVRYLIGFVGIVALVFLLLGLGVLLLIVASIRLQNGDMRSGFGPISTPPWLNLESFTVFLMLMIAGSLLSEMIGRPEAFPLFPALILQLVLMSIVFYPRIYGAGWRTIRQDLGLTAGSDKLKEFALGPVGYVAALPLVALGVILTLLIVRFTGMDPNQGMHPIVPLVKGEDASPLTAVMALLIAVVLAPLAEELTFRGFFYNALRSRFSAAVSIGLSSAFFAGIHPQGIIGFPMLMSIGIMLAALREWRGSLIAPIVAHACTNGVTMLIVLLGY